MPAATHQLIRRVSLAVGLSVALVACSSNGKADPPSTVAATAAVPAPAPSALAAGTSPASAPEATVAASLPSTNPPVSALITTTTVEPGAPVACTLLTVDELRFVAGEGVQFDDGKASEAQETPYGAHTACTWSATKGGDITVRVSVWDDASALDAARTQVGVVGELSGIGQQAFSSTLASIYAVADDHTVFVQFQDLDRDDADNLTGSTTLAQIAAGRL